MPTVDLTLAPSATATQVTVWICRLCGATAELVEKSTSADDTIEHFMDHLGWARIGGDEVVCPRCKLHPDVTNLLLAQGKARTQ